MSVFESSRFCSLEEYHNGKADIITPDLIFLGQDYDFVGMLHKPLSPGKEAYTVPVKAAGFAERGRNGLYIARVAGLDDDMKPGNIIYKLSMGSNGIAKFESDRGDAKEGYLRGYDDGLAGGLLSLTSELELVK